MFLHPNQIRLLFMLPLVFLSVKSFSSNALDIQLETLKGESVTLAEYQQGKPLYIKLWATWCQPCMKQMEHFEETHQKMGEGIQVVGVNVWINDSLPAIENVVKDKALNFPILIDKTGDLAQALNLIGTPLHVLIDQSGRVVHLGHEADADLDAKISVLALGELNPVELTVSDAKEQEQLQFDDDYNIHAVLFTATWCDWYLKDTRPQMSENCSASQEFVKDATANYSNFEWQLLASRLWTGEKELTEFSRKHGIKISSHVDQTNGSFTKYQIKNFPTLLLFKAGKEIGRIQEFRDRKNLIAELDKISY